MFNSRILTIAISALALAACSAATEEASDLANAAANEAANVAAMSAPPTTAPVTMGATDLTRGPAASEPDVPEGSVELTLKDDLDGDLNGYCFDIVGGGPNINPDEGLQAHTCYSYRGAVGSDQAIDPALLAQGIIKIPTFDVCAQPSSAQQGSKLSLTSCDNSEAQRFIISDSGTISPSAAPDLCATAGIETRRGRNGTSPHQIKELTLEPCDEALSDRQQWRTRIEDD